jgi:hypothetical protein
VGCG